MEALSKTSFNLTTYWFQTALSEERSPSSRPTKLSTGTRSRRNCWRKLSKASKS